MFDASSSPVRHSARASIVARIAAVVLVAIAATSVFACARHEAVPRAESNDDNRLENPSPDIEADLLHKLSSATTDAERSDLLVELQDHYMNRVELDLARAEERCLEALEIDRKLGRLDNEADTYLTLGTIHIREGGPKAAERFHLKALAINEDLDLPDRATRVAGTLCNLGNSHAVRGEFEAAEKYYHRALAMLEGDDLGRPDIVAACHANLGNLYHEKGDRETALKFLREALTRYQDLGPAHLENRVRRKIGELEEPEAGDGPPAQSLEEIEHP